MGVQAVHVGRVFDARVHAGGRWLPLTSGWGSLLGFGLDSNEGRSYVAPLPGRSFGPLSDPDEGRPATYHKPVHRRGGESTGRAFEEQRVRDDRARSPRFVRAATPAEGHAHASFGD